MIHISRLDLHNLRNTNYPGLRLASDRPRPEIPDVLALSICYGYASNGCVQHTHTIGKRKAKAILYFIKFIIFIIAILYII